MEIQCGDADDAHGDNMADVWGRMELRKKKQHSGGGHLTVQFHMFHVIGDCSPCYGNSFPKQEELQLAEATSSFRDQNFQEHPRTALGQKQIICVQHPSDERSHSAFKTLENGTWLDLWGRGARHLGLKLQCSRKNSSSLQSWNYHNHKSSRLVKQFAAPMDSAVQKSNMVTC